MKNCWLLILLSLMLIATYVVKDELRLFEKNYLTLVDVDENHQTCNSHPTFGFENHHDETRLSSSRLDFHMQTTNRRFYFFDQLPDSQYTFSIWQPPKKS